MSDRIAEIRARLDAATPGPWCLLPSSSTIYVREREEYPHAQAVDNDDAEFIANAPADIAWLLAHAGVIQEQIEFLKDDLSRVTAQRDRYKKRWHGAAS